MTWTVVRRWEVAIVDLPPMRARREVVHRCWSRRNAVHLASLLRIANNRSIARGLCRIEVTR